MRLFYGQIEIEIELSFQDGINFSHTIPRGVAIGLKLKGLSARKYMV